MNSISIDVIIVNYNSTDYTLNCIESIKKYIVGKLRITIVDNNSNDLPHRILVKYKNVNLIQNNKNIGFGKAVNYALNITNAKYVIILNPDAVVLDSSINKIFNLMQKHPKVAIAGPLILDKDGSVQGSARRFPTILTSIFGRKSPLTRLFPRNPITQREFFCFNGKKNKIQIVDWVSGACMVMRRKAIEQVGGFDEIFFMYWEDADLCMRLQEAGWDIVYYPKSQISHYIGKSSDTRPVSSIYQFHKSCFLYFKKHTRFPLCITSPIVIWGLCLRCLFVISLNVFQRHLDKEKKDEDELSHAYLKINPSPETYKILRIVSRLNIGGPSIHCSILTEGLRKDKFNSVLLTGTISPHEGDMSYLMMQTNGNLIKVPELQREIELKKDLKAFFKIARIIIKTKPHIVHTHLAKAGAISRVAVFIINILMPQKKIRSVHTYHGNVLEGYFNPFMSKIFITIEKVLAKLTDAIIAISQTQQWELTEKYKIAKKSKVKVINLGFDLTRLINLEGKGKLRDLIGVDNETILIGIVGRLTPIKNHHLFLDSANLINSRYPDKSIRFIIVGDGELRSDLEKYANEIGIAEQVIFYGWERNIQKVYADLDILVLTSNNEGTPVSIIESMAAGVPVVTTGVGGIKDLLGQIEKHCEDSNSYSICERGILCSKGNPQAVANGILYSIENDNFIRTSKAKTFVIEKYSDKQLVKKIEKLYFNLIEGR